MFVCCEIRMASLFIQLSTGVFIATVLLKCFITSDAVQSLSNEEIKKLEKIFKRLNNHFDPADTRIEPLIQTSDQDATSFKGNRSELDTANIRIERRSGSQRPWHCNATTIWRDLGNMHYPRFIKENLCMGESCVYGSYSCRSKNYALRVLVYSDTVNGEEDMNLPPSLRLNWKFVELQVSVACMCGL